ncbi:MAG TPA: peptide ABC transporter substrate-binding protein [Caulobacterales bacterium]|nr:peptide ABC transporter substrate-binding protein [Caulobacterales bacterium]
MEPNRRALLAGSVALGVAGCANGAVVGFDKSARSLDIANHGEPLTLDPHKVSSPAENNIVGNLFVGLTTENARAEPIPGMAERWETSEDGLTWIFYLRPAIWSDGVRCDAHDFVFAFRRVLDPARRANHAAMLYPIKNAARINTGHLPTSEAGVTALGDRVLEIQLEHPAPYLPHALKHPAAYPAPKHVLERHGDAWIKPENIAVNGPFALLKWWSNTIIHLRKNANFWDAEQVTLEDLYFYPVPDAGVGARGVINGERGWATDFPGARASEFRRRLPGYVHIAPSLSARAIVFNCTRTPFNDPRVRRALAMALDREAMAANGESAAYAYVPAGVQQAPASYAWSAMPASARRLEALQALQDAGFGPNRPLNFTLSCAEGADLAEAARGEWVALADWVGVEIAQDETAAHAARLRARSYDCALVEQAGAFSDPRPFLAPFETSAAANISGYANPSFDALVALSDAEPDPTKRAALLASAEQAALDDAPAAAVTFGASRNLVHPDLAGYADNLENIHRARWFGARGG